MSEIAAVDASSPGPVIAVALHAAHDVRAEVAALLAVSDQERLREEDPHTDSWARAADIRVTVLRSRFEVDLNRPRERAVYLAPEQAWGLHVWREPPPPDIVERSLALYDTFYAGMRALLDETARRCGSFVVLDLHSYNHRRSGRDATPDDPLESPDLNVGSAGVDRRRWAPLVDSVLDTARGSKVGGCLLGVRENVRFKGGHFVRWVNATYPGSGCALALEWKKTFMDEWTAEADARRIAQIGSVLERLAAAARTAIRGS